MNVLVVDDEPALVHYIAAALKDEADNISMAMNGSEALPGNVSRLDHL